MAAVLVLGVIAAIVMPRVTGGAETAKRHVCEFNCGQVNSAVERYFNDTGVWPSANLNELSSSSNYYFPDGMPTCPVSGAAYSLDVTGDSFRVVGHNDGDHNP